MKPKYWNTAKKTLVNNDNVLATVIKKYKGETLVSRGNSFETLLRSIVGQQISVKAASTVWSRLETFLNYEITPQKILESNLMELRKCGLSQRKGEYCKDLAVHFLEKKINPHKWQKMSDEDIINELVTVRGIGRWTAEMFLIFHLLRPNVLPVDDLGLQKAVSILYRKKYPMSKNVLKNVAKNWEPYKSVATWYLWRSLDPLPVEY